METDPQLVDAITQVMRHDNRALSFEFSEEQLREMARFLAFGLTKMPVAYFLGGIGFILITALKVRLSGEAKSRVLDQSGYLYQKAANEMVRWSEQGIGHAELVVLIAYLLGGTADSFERAVQALAQQEINDGSG